MAAALTAALGPPRKAPSRLFLPPAPGLAARPPARAGRARLGAGSQWRHDGRARCARCRGGGQQQQHIPSPGAVRPTLRRDGRNAPLAPDRARQMRRAPKAPAGQAGLRGRRKNRGAMLAMSITSDGDRSTAPGAGTAPGGRRALCRLQGGEQVLRGPHARRWWHLRARRPADDVHAHSLR